MKQDKMEIEITEDGLIKVTTDPISGANHVNAEEFIRGMSRQAGGEVTRARRTDVNRSLQNALHDHTKDGHTHQH